MEDVVGGGDDWLLLPNRKHLVTVFSNLCQPPTHTPAKKMFVCQYKSFAYFQEACRAHSCLEYYCTPLVGFRNQHQRNLCGNISVLSALLLMPFGEKGVGHGFWELSWFK